MMIVRVVTVVVLCIGIGGIAGGMAVRSQDDGLLEDARMQADADAGRIAALLEQIAGLSARIGELQTASVVVPSCPEPQTPATRPSRHPATNWMTGLSGNNRRNMFFPDAR